MTHTKLVACERKLAPVGYQTAGGAHHTEECKWGVFIMRSRGGAGEGEGDTADRSGSGAF